MTKKTIKIIRIAAVVIIVIIVAGIVFGSSLYEYRAQTICHREGYPQVYVHYHPFTGSVSYCYDPSIPSIYWIEPIGILGL